MIGSWLRMYRMTPRIFCLLLVFLLWVEVPVNAAVPAATEKKMAFQFENADLSKIVAAYAKASGQRFVLDPSFRGKATIMVPAPVKMEEGPSRFSLWLSPPINLRFRKGATSWWS